MMRAIEGTIMLTTDMELTIVTESFEDRYHWNAKRLHLDVRYPILPTVFRLI